MDIHLKRFLWYYRTLTNKEYPDVGEEVVVSHDTILLAGLDYWKFIYSLRTLVDKGYLKKGFRRRYIITKSLVDAVRSFLLEKEVNLQEKISNLTIYLFYLIITNQEFKSQFMMTTGVPSEKELAELVKKMYEVMNAVNEKLGVIIKRLEDLKEDLQKYASKVSGVSEDGEVGRIVIGDNPKQ